MNLNQLLNWTPAKRQMTMRGEKLVSQAAPNQAFWAVWREQKETLKAAGISVSKVGEAFVVTRYEDLGAEHQAKLAEAREASRATDAQIAIPAPEGLAYLPYQRAGIAFACQRPASLIADEMGLGKTIQAVGVINASDAKTILVICPASLRLNWKRELTKWLVTPRTIAVIESGKTPWPGDMAQVVIINYDLLKKFRAELRVATWDLLVADECHALKNSKAQRTKEVVGYQGKKSSEDSWSAIPARRRIMLTGTPIVNRPNELWPIVSFLDAGRWKNWFAFAKRYCGAVHNGYGWDFSGASHLDELQNALRESIMVRRLKSEVLKELPPKRRQIITVPANGAADCIKAEQEAEARNEAALHAARIAVELAKAGASDEEYQAAVQRLQSLSQIAFTEMAKCRHDTAVAKVPYVVEHLENCSEKVVVFVHHHDVADGIMEALSNGGSRRLDGDDVRKVDSSGKGAKSKSQPKALGMPLYMRDDADCARPDVGGGDLEGLREMPPYKARPSANASIQAMGRREIASQTGGHRVHAGLAGYRDSAALSASGHSAANEDQQQGASAEPVTGSPGPAEGVYEGEYLGHQLASECDQARRQPRRARTLSSKSAVLLDGTMNMAQRQAAVDRFQNDPECKYFIGSIRAAGVGLTLTAASHVVFAELDWTPGAMSQAEDRCHRIGQVNSVLVQHIVLDGSIDARMVHTIVAKQEVITTALDTEHAATVDPTFDLDAAMQDASENVAALELKRKLWQAERDAARAEREAKEMAKSAAREASRRQLEELAAKLTDEQVEAIHIALRLLDGMNQDRAQVQNMAGYNKIDTGIGAELANRATLTKLQAALGHKVLRKYKRQLPADLYASLYTEQA